MVALMLQKVTQVRMTPFSRGSVTNTAKDESNHHSPENQVCTQPADILAAECFDDLVQQTIIIVEHILNPHGSQCHGADDIRHINGGLEKFCAADAAGQNHGHQHGQAHGNDAAYQPNHHHVFHGTDKTGIAQDFEIVLQPIEAPWACRCRKALYLKETHDNCPNNRIDIHEQQAKNGGQNE